jgi:hypothetical protein
MFDQTHINREGEMGVSFTWIAADLPYIEHLIKENLKP